MPKGRKRKISIDDATHIREWYMRVRKIQVSHLAKLFRVSEPTIHNVIEYKSVYEKDERIPWKPPTE